MGQFPKTQHGYNWNVRSKKENEVEETSEEVAGEFSKMDDIQ